MTSKINRVHPLVIVNMSAKFDEDVHNSLVAIVFTRIRHDALTDARTDGTTAALLYPLCNALRGDNNKSLVTPIEIGQKFAGASRWHENFKLLSYICIFILNEVERHCKISLVVIW